MIPAACFLAVLLACGYAWHRDHQRTTKRAEDAETLADQYATELAEANAARKADREANDALMRIGARAVRRYADAALDAEAAEMFRAVAEARADIAETALRGLLTNLARQELIEPDETSDVVVAFERRAK